MTKNEAHQILVHLESSMFLNRFKSIPVDTFMIPYTELRDDACKGAGKQKHFCNELCAHKFHLRLEMMGHARNAAKAIKLISDSNNWSFPKQRFSAFIAKQPEFIKNTIQDWII